MPRSAREVPKEIAAFGERQFKDTGATAVEVLRVKAAVMRKHFSKLKGITFLVAVVSLDRVRVYFFNAAGVMLVGENIEPAMYGKVRRASKLIAKFEKPKILTPEELRIEATQELRDSLTKAIRRISRFLAISEPAFPDIFITRSTPISSPHSFGLQIGDDGEFLFEEAALGENSVEGVINRSAFITLLEGDKTQFVTSSIIGNGISLALLRGAERKNMLEKWRKKSKGSDSLPLVNHMISHAECFSSEDFRRILSLLQKTPENNTIDQWIHAMGVIHESVQVAIGTEEYHTIQGFCKTLEKPRKLEARRHKLEAIHLAPRVICDPTPLDIHLLASIGKSSESAWAEVNYLDANTLNSFSIGSIGDDVVNSIEYWLNLEDVYPSSGGLISQGKDVIRRALVKLGHSDELKTTFEAKLEFSEKELKSTERAVLERLITGQLDVLSNTLVGSPQVIETLLKTGRIALLPGFNHIGVNPDFLLRGKPDGVRSTARLCCLEATIFNTESEAIAVVSAPGTWKSGLIKSASSGNLSLWPILSTSSQRNILRDEQPFSNEPLVRTWTNGAI